MILLFSIILYCIIDIITSKRDKCSPLTYKCPFNNDKELFVYFANGLPSKTQDDIEKFIFCVNEYYTCGHIIDDIDKTFQETSGVFIGSAIDLYSIRPILSELDLSFEDDIKEYTEVSGEEAQKLLDQSPLDLTIEQTDELNEKVYQYRHSQLQILLNEKIRTHSVEQALLALYIKYYNHDVIADIQPFISEAQWDNVAYYISAMKGPYRQRKLLSLALDSFKASHEGFFHIGFLFDSKISDKDNSKADWEKEKDFMTALAIELDVTYTISSSTQSLVHNKRYKEVDEALKEYKYAYIEQEKFQDGINRMHKELEAEKAFDVYYQTILILFINSKPDDNTIDLSDLYDNRISMYIIGVLSDKLTLDDLNKIADQYASVIPLKSYNEFSEEKDKEALFRMLHSALSKQIEVLNFRQGQGQGQGQKRTAEVIIDNITMTKSSSQKYFLMNVISSEIFKYHIQMIYHNRIPIDMNIFISSSIPYPDYYNNDIMHLGLSVENPFLNYATERPFYIAVFTNELNYSLIITKCSEKEECEVPSNGLYKNNTINLYRSSSNSFYSFENCLRKVCRLSPIELFTKYSRGIINTYNDDSLFLYDSRYVYNSEILNCLFSNYYCGYINTKSEKLERNYGVMLGMGLNLSESNQIVLHQKYGLSKTMINKLTPFLKNSDIQTADGYMNRLQMINLNFTTEEMRRIDKHNVSYTFRIIENNFKQCFDQFAYDIKYALLLNKYNKHQIHIDEEERERIIEDMCEGNYTSYLNLLYNNKDKDDEQSINMQAMLITFSDNKLSYKTIISIVVGKSFISNECLVRFINNDQFDELKISVSYYDSEIQRVVTVGGFDDKKLDIKEALSRMRDQNAEKNETIDIDHLLRHQIDLFNYYDYGFKKIILIITNYVNDNNPNGTQSIKPPSNITLSHVRENGIEIIHLTNRNDILLDDNNDSSDDSNGDWLYIGNKVYYSDFEDISIDELFKTISRMHIPISQLKPIVTDLQKGESAYYQLYFAKDPLDDDDDHDDDDDYSNSSSKCNRDEVKAKGLNENAIKLIFDSNKLNVFISKKYPYPSIYNNDIFGDASNSTGRDWNILVPFDKDKPNMTFYMTIHALENVSYLTIDIEECDADGLCGDTKSKRIIAFSFGFAAIVLVVYGIYNCFCDINMNIKTNIYD